MKSITREELVEELSQKKVEFSYGEEFRNSISECLEQLLDVSKASLSPEMSSQFETEVVMFQKNVLIRMKKANRVKKRMLNRFKDYFSIKIQLVDPPLVEVCILEIAVQSSTFN